MSLEFRIVEEFKTDEEWTTGPDGPSHQILVDAHLETVDLNQMVGRFIQVLPENTRIRVTIETVTD